MRRLTENEVREFYEAYREMEARARAYHTAALRHLIQRDLLFFALILSALLGTLLFDA